MITKFICDIGSNHNQDFDRAVSLITEAKAIGCHGVKFQWYRADDMYSRTDVPAGFRKTELNPDWIPALAEVCRSNQIEFGMTPFSLDMPAKLVASCDFLKIASYEILRNDLIRESMNQCKLHDKTLMVSTGMANFDEVMNVLQIASDIDFRNLILYHCTAKYPAKFSDCELNTIRLFMEVLPRVFEARARDNIARITAVGWSDHSCEPGVIHRAVCNGARYIEFHLDLDDKKGWESQHGHCWTSSEIERVITDVRVGEDSNHINAKGHVYSKEERLMRADPSDGKRPHKEMRKQ